MTESQIIVLATPVFLGLIALEWWWGVRRGRNTYRLNDAINSVGLGMMSQVVGVLTRLAVIGLYTWAYEHVALWRLPADAWWVWAAALLFYDLCYYVHHRAGHRVALLWAAHAVHHQSEEYNLSTALRQTSSGWLAGWLFYLPMAVAGVPPLVFGTVALIDLLYQYWVHTRQIGKLGWFDRWFCAPSNHRVHHAVNDRYLDRNYGGIFIFWDRLFGSYAEEDDAEPPVYGTRAPLRSWNPLRANLQVYAALAQDSWRAAHWGDKLRVWFKPPGWRPVDVALKYPKPPFELSQVQAFDPPLAPRTQVLAAACFALALLATVVFLWHAHVLGPLALAGGAAVIVGMLWGVGVMCTGRAGAETAAHTGHRPQVRNVAEGQGRG
jgi:alkylglycerol monooxygenase